MRQTYDTWKNMIRRCTDPDDKDFVNYGGRGITVCERWHTFANFVADMGERPAGLTLERIDNDKGYTPENCRWATYKEQANNMRTNRLLTLHGTTRRLHEWSTVTGLGASTILRRLHTLGWSVEEALTLPRQRPGKNRKPRWSW